MMSHLSHLITISLMCTLALTILACDDSKSTTTSDNRSESDTTAGTTNAGEDIVSETDSMTAGDVIDTDMMMAATVLPPWTWDIQDHVQLNLIPQPFQLTLIRQNEIILTLHGEDLGFGIVDQRQDDLSYDPYWLHHEFLGSIPPPPAGLRWISIDHVTRIESDPNETNSTHTLMLQLTDDTQAKLTLTQSSEQSIALQLQKVDASQVAYTYWQNTITPEENFYGLGESFDHVARLGTYRALNFQPLLETESGYNEAHIPVPLLISTHHLAYFHESYLPSYFDVGYQDLTQLRVEQAYTDGLEDTAIGLKLHLMWHDHPFEAINTYYELTTRPLIPPYWSFAPHYWRNVTTGQAEVEADLQQMRTLQIPGGVFWIDRPYQNAYNDCQFDPNKYEDPNQMMQTYQDLGYRMLLWHAPYTSEASDAWEEASSNNYFLDGPQFFLDFGRVMDFTNPGAVDLWQSLLERFNTYQVAGYKLDYGEDVQVGVNNRRLRFNFHDGSNELTMHHKYASYYHQTYLDTLPHIPPRPNGDQAHLVDGFILGRSSTFNGQDRVHALWPGDLDSDFTTHLEDGYWVGGLPAGVIAGLTLAASGFPIFAADTGGFRNGRPTQEVLIRWAWQTAFSAIMQVGGGGSSHFPWAEAGSTEEVYDEDGIQWMKEAAQWNIRLADYRFTWALLSRTTGVPLVRPWGMMYPKDGRHPDDAYLLGPDLLIAPIIGENDRRQVPIPTGVWINLWTQDTHIGPTEVMEQVSLGSQAVFIRQGAIIPLLDEKIVTLNAVSEYSQTQGVRSRINEAGTLTWLIAPGSESDYTNHDGHHVQLNEKSIYLAPATMAEIVNDIDEYTPQQIQRAQQLYQLPVYPSFALDLRFNASQDTPAEFMLDDVLLMEVTTVEDWQTCMFCLWRPMAGKVQIKLPPHDGLDQIITW